MEYQTEQDIEETNKRYQLRSDVFSGVINSKPVFEYLEFCKVFGEPVTEYEDIEIPAYAREVSKNLV